MANNRDVTYTRHFGVRLKLEHREGLRKYAVAHDTGISIVLREATLEEIGRKDLSLDKETTITIGRMLERERSNERPSRPHGYTSRVNVTDAQYEAFEQAAKTRGVSLSELVRKSGLKKAGLLASAKAAKAPKAAKAKRGRPVGSRNRTA